jgi:hypothetical protein
MAGIDKTYVNYEQWLQAKKFAEETQQAQIDAMGRAIQLYYTEDIEPGSNDITLWNTSVLQDAWLYQNCKLDFIQSRLKYQYNNKFPELFSLMDFNDPGVYLVSISSENVNMDFFYEEEGETMIYDRSDTIVVYGTHLLLKAIDEIKEFLHFRGSKKLDYDLDIMFYGLNMHYSSESNKWFLTEGEGDELKYEKELEPFPFTTLQLPNIKWSFEKKDFFSVRPESIFFASEKEVYHLTDFKEWEKYAKSVDKLWLDRFGVPEYIATRIK